MARLKRVTNLTKFIERGVLIHGSKYQYEKSEYVDSRVPVIITCPIHGDFLQCPSQHIKGHGCIKCLNASRFTAERFINSAKEIHGEVYDYSKVNYKNSDTKIIIVCKLHGDFLQAPHVHLQGKGCSPCGIEERTAKSRKDINHFIKRSTETHGDKYDYSESVYTKADAMITVRCKKHGPFDVMASQHMRSQGCRRCYDDATSERRRREITYSTSDFYIYRLEVTSLTNITLQQYGAFIDHNNLKSIYEVDHMYSVSSGFQNKIRADVIANICNLRMLDVSSNRIKWANCAITIEELQYRIKFFEKHGTLRYDWIP